MPTSLVNFLKRFICEAERQTDKQTEREIIHLLGHSRKWLQKQGPSQEGAQAQVHMHWLSSAAFPGLSARVQKGSEEAGIQTPAHMGCQYHRQQLTLHAVTLAHDHFL